MLPELWHLLTLLGERSVSEYGLPPWAQDPTIRGLLIPEAEFQALEGKLGTYRRACQAPSPPAMAQDIAAD